MKLLYRCCAGLDIHRDTVSACVRKRVRGQAEASVEEQVFGTFTQDLERLRRWLKQHKVRQVAMESTGVYWIPVWNVLEGGFTLTLVNPANVRALRGQKTDRIDARRIAEYLQYGLLRGSFIPPKPIRELRELTRLRVHIQQDRNRVINRITRLLETVNLKLASVASNIIGMSGMAMLRLLASGVCDPERPSLHILKYHSLSYSPHIFLSNIFPCVDARIDGLALPQADLLRRLSTIPGVDRTTALVLIAEFGTDMVQFPTPRHLASWAGLCPGNAESAGKRFSGRARKGDRYVRRILVQSAWAAARANDCFLAALFFRTAQRRGLKKAAVAVAHRIAIVAWHILAEQGVEYRERGGDSFDRRNPERTARKLSRRLEAIGYKVTLIAPPQPVAPRPEPTKPRKPAPVSPHICKQCHAWRIPHCIHVRNRSNFHSAHTPPIGTTG